MSSESRRIAPAADAHAIAVHGIAKTYRVWASPAARLRAMLSDTAARALPAGSGAQRRMQAVSASQYHDFTALQPLDFTVDRGESVAIIGRNGSGKSTLLQIIAGTLYPSAGDVRVRGRVAALLELGSAFHPQFTGRENVYLYCAILGIGTAQVDALFDEIAAFADIGEFIAQPVQTYSSGMMLRLAFAVQTAIAPDILIVDEALAVGDVFFQAKCMRRIRQMIDDGTTLLFVSHAMSTVREVCARGLLLDHGKLILDGDSGAVTQRYLALQLSQQAPAAGTPTAAVTAAPAPVAAPAARAPALAAPRRWALEQLHVGDEMFARKAAAERIQNFKAMLLNVQLLDAEGRFSDSFDFGEDVTLRMLVDVLEPVNNLWIGYHIRTKTGIDAVHVDSNLAGRLGHPFESGRRYVLDWQLRLCLQHGEYYLMCVLAAPDQPYIMQPQWDYIDVVNHAYDFSVAPRRQGMISGLVAIDSALDIRLLDGGPDAQPAPS